MLRENVETGRRRCFGVVTRATIATGVETKVVMSRVGGVVTSKMMMVGVVMVVRKEARGVQHQRRLLVYTFSRTRVSSIWRAQA